MSIIRFEPFRGFDSVAKRMNTLLTDFDRGFTVEYGAFSPKVDIKEDEKQFHITAELPGIEKSNTKITLNDDNVLSIKGKKERLTETDDKSDSTFLKVERAYGEFTRSFQLPDNILTDTISAKFENGILFITIDKKEPTKPKEVEIEIS
jgi:HSP20 family protein